MPGASPVVTAKSARPSPFQSPVASAPGAEPTRSSVARLNEPLSVTKIVSTPETPSTARSRRPSPLTSAVANA